MQDTSRAGHRGRVVMLVDNDAVDAVRIHKAAQSAVDTGWDVTVVGHCETPVADWRLGEVKLRILPMPKPMATAPGPLRRFRPSRPLAYRDEATAARRSRQVHIMRTDLAARRTECAVGPSDRRAELVNRARSLTGRLRVAIASRWVALRRGQTPSASDEPGQSAATLDRLTVRGWALLRGRRAWRSLEPSLWDYEIAFGDAIDALRPDLIHVNGSRLLGVAARAKLRARVAGNDPVLLWDADAHIPDLTATDSLHRHLAAIGAYEAEYRRHVDAVVTASDELADELRKRHGLDRQPSVVLDAPDATLTGAGEIVPDVRSLCGIDKADSLLVYRGEPAFDHGTDVMVRALPELGDVHLAMVVHRPQSAAVTRLRRLAGELGVAERLHVLPYVPQRQLLSFLSGADAAVIPLLRLPHHEIALIPEFFEYAHARLPLIVSDVKAMARTARNTGHGEVFWAGNTNDYVRAVKLVLADPRSYRDAYERHGLLDGWTWQAQATTLDTVYTRLFSGGEGCRAIGATGPKVFQPDAARGAETLPSQPVP